MYSVFDQLQQAKIFTKLDHQKTLIIYVESGIEISGRLVLTPFRLTNAPAVFQAMINDVLRDFPDHFTYVYLKNILIFFRSWHTQEACHSGSATAFKKSTLC